LVYILFGFRGSKLCNLMNEMKIFRWIRKKNLMKTENFGFQHKKNLNNWFKRVLIE
jgi:hypothetical protein